VTAFPTPWLIRQEVFTGTGEDELGNDVQGWAAPADVRAIAIQPSSVENINGYSSRVVADVDVAVPSTVTVGVRDRFTLPDAFGAGAFEVIAIEDASYGFHQWQAGIILKLRRVTG
jgi:hypothetical protein